MRIGFGRWAALVALVLVECLAVAKGARAQVPPNAAPTVVTPTTPLPVPNELLRVSPGGITSAEVGERAAATSYSAKANQQAMLGAAARVDEAWAAFLPRLTGTAQYTQLSYFLPGNICLIGQCFPGAAIFPVIPHNYLLQASLNIPISDYFLRLAQGYSAATHSEDAARFDVETARTQSAADGRVTYYSWLRARGAVIVAVQALNDQRDHLKLARNQFDAGQASRADVLRAETNEAAAEVQVEHTRNLALLAEEQLSVAMHATPDAVFVPGEDLEGTLPSVHGNVRELVAEAETSRLEIKSIDANAAAARAQAKAARGQAYPSLSGFGDAVYANPNARYFPPERIWFPTWDLGARLVWSPNDTLTASASAHDIEARAGQLDAQKGTIRDNIRLEVVQAFENVHESDVNLDATQRELASAQEAYRVAKELFNNGRATSTTLTDSETELTRSRLDLLNARADARIARVRLEHALGRDVRMVRNAAQ